MLNINIKEDLLKVSVLWVIVIQLIAMIFFPIFSINIDGFKYKFQLLRNNEIQDWGGFEIGGFEKFVNVALKWVYFLIGLYYASFGITLIFLVYLYKALDKKGHIHRLIAYIFVIFCTITTLLGGFLFFLWITRNKEKIN